MENLILDFFKRYKQLHLKDLLELYKISSLKTLKAGDLIVRNGDVFRYTIAIRKGMIRTYLIKSNGEERTVRITKEGDFVSSALSLLRGEPSEEYLEALEDCKVIYINSDKLRSLIKDNMRLLLLWNDSIMDAFLEAIERIEFFTTLSPEERYANLLEKSPDLVNRVPQKYLASYIGVSTVSLSRIKARMSKKT